MTEKLIQDYIWENKDNLNKLFVEVEFPNEIVKNKPWEITPSEVIFNTVIANYKRTWSMVKDMFIFGCEVPLKKNYESTIRADFLGIFNGTNGVAIIELKKSAQTERQAFTELLGYGNHIHTIFAPMSKIDIAYILISPMKERIVRESLLNNIINEKNTTFALIPSWENDDVTTLKLTPWIPTLIEINNLMNASFAENNFDLYKITWDGLPGEWSPEEEGDNPDQFMIERMNIVSAYAAQIMEAKGIHGFVYCSQAYSETRSQGHLINSIVVVGLNPYKATKNRKLLKDNPTATAKEVSTADVSIFNMLDIIPELKNKYYDEKDTTNYFSDLSMIWSDGIASVGFDIVKTLTKSLDKKSIETSYGGFVWDSFQHNFQEDIMTHNFDIRPTGLIRELYWEYSKLDYDYIRVNGCDEHPICFGGDDIPNYMVDIMTNQYYFRDFIRRLFNPFHEIDFDEA
jgi:hypothetical protein